MSPATESLPADLVLEGGGVKGIALAGALSRRGHP
jgi:predicted acylesterase/phospholipase RssA